MDEKEVPPERRTLEQVGREFADTRERIREIEAAAADKRRKQIEDEPPDDD